MRPCWWSGPGAGWAASQSSWPLHAGAIVLAPGLPEDQDYLGGMGAAEVLDRNADIVAAVRGRYPDGVDALARPGLLRPRGG